MQNIILQNGQFISVGQQAVMFSSDGLTWQKQTPNNSVLFHSVVKALGQIIIVGENGSIETSISGTTWTPQTSNTSQTLRDIISNDSNLFVAVGDASTILTSTDGITWIRRAISIASDLKTIVYGNGLFLAAGNNSTVITSSDGITWTSQPGIDSQPINDVIFDGTRFILVGNQANLFISTDGIVFTPINQGDTRNFTGIATNGNSLIRVGNSTEIYKSSNGINWTAVSSQTYSINQVEYFNGGFIAVGDSGLILTSPDGNNWTQQSIQNIENINDVYWFSGLDAQGTPFSLYVAVGNNGLLLTSTDAINWQQESTGQTPVTENFYGIDHDNDYFVVVGQNGKILVRNNTASPGGTTWMDFFSNTAFGTLHDIIYNGTTNIIVGDAGIIVTGTALSDNFSSLVTNFNDNFLNIAFNGNRYIIACDNGNIYTSTDGSNWLKDIARSTKPIRDILISPTTIANGSNNNNVFAVGDGGTIILGEFK